MEMSILVKEIFDVVRGEVKVHSRHIGVNGLVGRIKKIEELMGELSIDIIEV